MTIEFRKANKEDKAFIKKMLKENMGHYFKKHFGSWDEEKFESNYESSEVNIVEKNNTKVGFFLVEPKDRLVHIHEIQLKKKFQKQGIGKRIINFIEEKYKNHKKIILKVFKDNPSIKFYKKQGFQIEGEAHDGSSYLMVKKIG